MYHAIKYPIAIIWSSSIAYIIYSAHIKNQRSKNDLRNYRLENKFKDADYNPFRQL